MTKRISMVSFRMGKSERRSFRPSARRRAVVRAALDQAMTEGATHILLPGWTFCYSDDEVAANTYREEVEWLRQASKELLVSLIAELTWSTRNKFLGFRSPPEEIGFLLFESGVQLKPNIRQKFTSSGSVARPQGLYESVASEVFCGERDFKLGDLSFLMLVCGENNLLANVQNEGNRVILRHCDTSKNRGLPELQRRGHQIVLNPAHTEMGNLGKMKRRWEWLSKPTGSVPTRYCFYTSNVRDGSPGGRAAYAFRNGRQIAASAWGENPGEDFSVLTVAIDIPESVDHR